MKKFTLLMGVAMLLCQTASAQGTIPNADFENWVDLPNTFGGRDPEHWKSTNSATAGANRKAIVRSQDSYSGTFAMEIRPLVSSSATDTTLAAVALGAPPLNFSTYELDYANGGWDFAGPLVSVNGYYKYDPDPLSHDSAYVLLIRKDTQGNIADQGKFVFQTAHDYTFFSIPIIHFTVINPPDSLAIGFFYESTNQSAVPPGLLLIDSLHVVTENLDVDKTEIPTISLYPNPADDAVYINYPGNGSETHVEILDMTGKTVIGSAPATGEKNLRIDLTVLRKGAYILRLTDRKNARVYTKQIIKN